MQVIASYFPSRNKIFDIYDSKEEALKEVKYLNCFSSITHEKLQVAIVEISEEEYKEFMEGKEVNVAD